MIQGDHTNTTQTGTQAHTLARTEARRHGGEVKMRDREWPSTAPEWSPSLQAGKPTKELSHSRSWVHLPRFQPTCRAQTVFSVGQAERSGPWSTHGAHSHFHCFAFSFEKKSRRKQPYLAAVESPDWQQGLLTFPVEFSLSKRTTTCLTTTREFFLTLPTQQGEGSPGHQEILGLKIECKKIEVATQPKPCPAGPSPPPGGPTFIKSLNHAIAFWFQWYKESKI